MRRKTLVIGLAAALSGIFMIAGVSACSPSSETSSSDSSAAQSFDETAVQGDARLDDPAQLIIDCENWQAFTANSASVILGAGTDSDPLLAEDRAIKNSCFSPVSLYCALALVAEGTDGQAQQQVMELLGQENEEELGSFCRAWMDALQKSEDTYSLQLANSIWSNLGYKFKVSYVDSVKSSLDAAAFAAEFGTDDTNREISGWISDKTQGLLNPQITTSSDEIAALINTLYFKDAWAHQFESANTMPDVFHAEGGDVQASFMNQNIENCAYAEGGNFKAVGMGFQGGAQMTFYLPNDGVDVNDLVVDSAAVTELLNTELELREVNVSIPKFVIDSSFDDLVASLEKLGVTDVFDPTNSGMFDPMIESSENGEDFYISDAIQETHISIDENGAEAAAYTSMGIRATSMPVEIEPVDFVLDRPFVYTVQSPDGVMLFIGIVSQPSE